MMEWHQWVNLITGVVSAVFRGLSWFDDRKRNKRNNPSSSESKTDRNVG